MGCWRVEGQRVVPKSVTSPWKTVRLTVPKKDSVFPARKTITVDLLLGRPKASNWQCSSTDRMNKLRPLDGSKVDSTGATLSFG
jgi:hypothetical protein